MSNETQQRLYKPFNILTLSGGGVRGVVEAVVLERLRKEFPHLLRDTDLIAGVSTGGIQALGLAAGHEPPELKEFYVKCAKLVFEDSIVDDTKDLWRLAGADYSNTNLRKILEMQFGDMRLGDLEKRVAVLAFDLDNEAQAPERRSWKYKVFHNIERTPSDAEVRAVDVGLYTSAAPIYFPSVDGYIDGGVVANNPSRAAITQALDVEGLGKNVRVENINLLSLGTGKVNRHVKGKRHDWGLVRWAMPLLYILFEGSEEMVHHECQQLLRKRYKRINPYLSQPIPMDDWRQIPRLIGIAEEENLTGAVEWLQEYWL